ncbi:MAG: hypothetical protein O7D93_08260 [Acidobacteria bacterium]|nr:hypothetical protein [Acidobacteriota bacterium]MCZ6877715.1 hypothetical protein [Acidobacteriota bacterium]
MSAKSIFISLFLPLFLTGGLTLAQEGSGLPEHPNNLRVFTRYDGATAVAELSWQDHSDDEVGFEILRSDNGKEFRVVGMVGADTAHWEDKVGKYITGGFAYKVRAFNEAGKSEDSNVVSIWL